MLTRVLHGPSSWCCVLHETGAGLLLARGTFTAAILHAKWDLTGHTRRPSKRLPQRLTAVPAADHSHPHPTPPEETLILIYQWKEVRYSGKGPGEAIN